MDDNERAISILRLDVAHYRLLYYAALDALALTATAPERADQIQRELRKEREAFMAGELARAQSAPHVGPEAR